MHPELEEHIGWKRMKTELKQAVKEFEEALQRQVLMKSRYGRPKRSILGLATTGDVGQLEAKLQVLQVNEDRTRKTLPF